MTKSQHPSHTGVSRRRSLGRTILGLATAVACVAAITSPAAAADPAPKPAAAADMPGFYTPPAALPAANGAIVRTEPLKLGLSLPGINGQLPGTATRLMYKSTDSAGAPVAVTGAYIEPEAEWKGKGNRPLVVLAPGTMGQGDNCATSMGLENPLSLNLGDASLAFGYEVLSVYSLLDKGMSVVVTDYVGLGTTDRVHTYVNRVDQAHAVLDAARAAQALPDTSINKKSKVGLFGYSQGGGAAASASEEYKSYAPELNVSGAYVGAPPANLAQVIDGIDGSAIAGALGWTINGMLHYNPELQGTLDTYMNEQGAKFLTESSTSCLGDAIFKFGFKNTKDLTKNGKSLSEIVASEPEIKAIVDEQRIGKKKPTVPVRVATGVADDTVPHKQARQLAVDWCGKRGDVTYEAIMLPNLGDKLVLTNHMLPFLADQGDAINWMEDRFNGKRTKSNCFWMPFLP